MQHDEGSGSQSSPTLYTFMSELCEAGGIKREQLHAMLPTEDVTGEPPPAFGTWIRRMAAITLDHVFSVNNYAVLLAKIDLSKADSLGITPTQKEKIEGKLKAVRGELDKATLIHLIHSGFLLPLFTVDKDRQEPSSGTHLVDSYSLEWMIAADHRSDNELNSTLNKWQYDALDNNFFLFLTSYRLWVAMVANDMNPEITLKMARHLAQVATGYGMFAEVLKITDYALNILDQRIINGKGSYFVYIRTSRLLALRAAAHGRLIDVPKAEAIFREALQSANMAKQTRLIEDADFRRYLDVHTETVRMITRERIRMYAHIGIEELPSYWSTSLVDNMLKIIENASPGCNIFGLIDEFERQCEEGHRVLPIDWDTLARAYLLFRATSKEYLLKAVEFSDKATEMLKQLHFDENERDVNASTLTMDCLDTTRILLHCALNEWKEAAILFQRYDNRIPLEDRRLTRRPRQNVKAILDAGQPLIKSPK